MTSVTLYHIDPSQNMSRFYTMDIQQDLFGNTCLVRTWGRKGKKGQMPRSIPFQTASDAEAAFSKLLAAKQRKGYVQH